MRLLHSRDWVERGVKSLGLGCHFARRHRRVPRVEVSPPSFTVIMGMLEVEEGFIPSAHRSRDAYCVLGVG